MTNMTTSRLILAAALFAGGASAQTPKSSEKSPPPVTSNPSSDAAAESRAGQAPLGEGDAQQSANAQSEVPQASVNEEVKKADGEKVCDKRDRTPSQACEEVIEEVEESAKAKPR